MNIQPAISNLPRCRFGFSHKHKPHLSVSITGSLNVEVIFPNTKFRESFSKLILWFPSWDHVCVLKHAIPSKTATVLPEVIFSFPDVYLPSVALPMTGFPYRYG